MTQATIRACAKRTTKRRQQRKHERDSKNSNDDLTKPPPGGFFIVVNNEARLSDQLSRASHLYRQEGLDWLSRIVHALIAAQGSARAGIRRFTARANVTMKRGC